MAGDNVVGAGVEDPGPFGDREVESVLDPAKAVAGNHEWAIGGGEPMRIRRSEVEGHRHASKACR